MSVTLLEQPVATLPHESGPWRRDDYASLPDEPRCELIHGRFYLSPNPLFVHQRVATRIWRLLDDIAEATGGEAACAPLDVHLADHTVAQPDVIYVSPGRRGIVRKRVEGAPDLVVEVLSPSTAAMDRVLKLNRYGDAGVKEYWLVDPTDRRFEVLVHDGERFVVQVKDIGVWKSPVVPGVELDIAAFWTEVDRRALPGPTAD